MLIVLVGPSGSGKSQLMTDLCDRLGFTALESYTDRPRRNPDEKGHVFVSTEEIRGLKLLNSTVFGGYTYGVTAEQLAEADICIMEPSGAQAVRAQLEPEQSVHLIGVTASSEDIRARLMAAGQSEADVDVRLARDARIFDGMASYVDFLVCNPNGGYESALNSIISYIVPTKTDVRTGWLCL